MSESMLTRKQEKDCWLLVWAGTDDWHSQVKKSLANVKVKSGSTHHILSREVEGERWSLLLVHYSKEECDEVVEQLRDLWDYGFVNAVQEVKDPV